MKKQPPTSNLPKNNWLEIINPDAKIGKVKHALFDFDGTISVIRQGWETIMIPLMVEMICGDHPATSEIEREVAEYVDRSTGILTLKQMEWLEAAVHRYGLARHPKSAREYKRIYNERLLRPVQERLDKMDGSLAARDTLMIVGVRGFLESLVAKGVNLYLASGTDHVYVTAEATALGVADFFGEHIYGAKDDDASAMSKADVIENIFETYHLAGENLLVIGDGPVEIRHAKARGAVSLGIAANETTRHGLDTRKRERLLTAGADFIVTDFSHHRQLVDYFAG